MWEEIREQKAFKKFKVQLDIGGESGREGEQRG